MVFRSIDVRKPGGVAAIALGCLLLSLFFFAPRLWLMRTYVPGSFQWDRGESFLKQCEQPLRRDVEPAMKWRILPPAVAHTLGLTGKKPFIIPWIGVMALIAYVAVLHARRLPDAQYVFGGTLLAATTSAVLVPVGWLGINDAWVWLGLIAVAFGRAKWVTPIACLLCPWIDERFVIGLPLAWTARRLEQNLPFFSKDLLNVGWLVPYIAIRLLLGGNPATERSSIGFLAGQIAGAPAVLPMAPLGWWMGLRVGWLAIGYATFTSSQTQRWWFAGVLVITFGTSLFLASDVSRSVAVALPFVLLGNFAIARRECVFAPKAALLAGCVNLLIPAAHVVLNKIDPINPLPFEIFRLIR